MLDPRIYRAGWVPLIFVLVIVAFSLREEPRAIEPTLPAQAFDGSAALADLKALAADPAARDRRPATPGDDALAGHIAAGLSRRRFAVSTRRFDGETAIGKRQLTAVIGERTGFSNRRIIVVAARDSLKGRAYAGLSSSAALLELARVLGGRTLGRTLDLVSTTGGAGGAGAVDVARHLGGPVDAVLVLGDLGAASSHKPWIVPFSRSGNVAPLRLRQTVTAAVLAETGEPAGGIHPAAQWARLAFPLTLSGQGPLLGSGVPSVMLAPGGERDQNPSGEVSVSRLEAFGRAALRTVTALDAGPPVPAPSAYVVVAHKVLPAWAVRLLVAALILPALLATVDGYARARRRRESVGRWLRWVAAGIAPFVLLVLFLRALRAVGLIVAAPPQPVAGDLLEIGTRGAVLLGCAAAVLALGWLAMRPLLLRLARARGEATGAGSAAALMLVLCVVTVVAWALNPFAAVLLVPALHAWMLATAPEVRPGRLLGAGLAVVGWIPALLVAFYYATQFGLGPLETLWSGALLVAGGGISLPAALGWCVALGCGAGVFAAVFAHRRGLEAEVDAVSVRGPVSYAGPGSLGGTESALRR